MDGDTAVLPDSQPEHASAAASDIDEANLKGGVPDSRTSEQETNQPDDAPETTVGASNQSRRPLKLVLTLTPVDTAGYRCLLAVGADTCDPLLWSLEVGDLPGALQEAASLVAAAEERWQSQPRNPASANKTGAASAKRSGANQQSPDERSPEPVTTAPDSESAQPGQLPLFG